MKLAFSTLGCPEWDIPTIAAKAAEYGYDGLGDTDAMIDAIVAKVQDIYSAYANITFTTRTTAGFPVKQ